MAARTHVHSIDNQLTGPSTGQPADPAVAALPSRPVLSTARRRCWRDQRSLQFGRSSTSAVVLSGLDPGARRVLKLLDGTRTTAAVLIDGAAAGCPPPRTIRLLTLLHEAGLLEDAAQGHPALAALTTAERDQLAPDVATLRLQDAPHPGDALARRRTADVVVLGAGRVGAPLANLLEGAGVGQVLLVDDGLARLADVVAGGVPVGSVGLRRGPAALPSSASVAVLAPAAGEPLAALLPQLPVGAPHLLAEVREATGVVGPFVLPGQTPCLRCLDLDRTDRDPGWPALAGQLADPAPGPTACAGPLAVAVAAQACLQVLTLLDGPARPASVGGTLELTLPDWRWRRRSWPAHPACGCGARP